MRALIAGMPDVRLPGVPRADDDRPHPSGDRRSGCRRSARVGVRAPAWRGLPPRSPAPMLDLTDLDSIGPWMECGSTRPRDQLCRLHRRRRRRSGRGDRPSGQHLGGGSPRRGDRPRTGSGSSPSPPTTSSMARSKRVTSSRDRPNPINVYGLTKLEGEHLALRANPEALVIRTSWLLSSTHRNFLTTMLTLLAEGEVSVVDDQRGRPTLVDDLVGANPRRSGRRRHRHSPSHQSRARRPGSAWPARSPNCPGTTATWSNQSPARLWSEPRGDLPTRCWTVNGCRVWAFPRCQPWRVGLERTVRTSRVTSSQ